MLLEQKFRRRNDSTASADQAKISILAMQTLSKLGLALETQRLAGAEPTWATHM
jgi:hypothetical protein